MSSVILKPEYAVWPEVLQANRQRTAEIASALGTELFAQVRNEVAQEAVRYSKKVRSTARELRLALGTTDDPIASRGDIPIVMAGHQPNIFHCGILFKTTMLSRCASNLGCRAIQVVIDTDEGDGGLVRWPRLLGRSLEIRERSLADYDVGEGQLYHAQRIASREVVRELFAEMVSDLRQAGLHSCSERLDLFANAYEALSGQPVSLANTIVRWMVEKPGYDEVTLSALISTASFRELLRRLVADGPHLAEVYNSCLDSYRREHRIENVANPFPNLKKGSEGQELPLWRLAGTGRKPLYRMPLEAGDGKESERICPRGSMTTLLLRAYCSDMFIHGVGGAKYDAFVDMFAQRYLGLSLPRFVVGSETRYLFPEEVSRLSREVELASQVKEMTSRTEQFLGKGIFSDSEERELQSVVAARAELRTAIQKATTAEMKKSITHELNIANKAVRSIIEEGSLKEVITRAASTQASLAKWSFREFPFFLF